jgi:hypothetical protein
MKTKTKFVFKTEKTIREQHIEITRWQSAELRRKLPKGIYFIQIEERGMIQWNVPLLVDLLISGDRPEHQALVEEYLSTLPQAA